ncbi:MAG TPA: thioredoxin domain-containing protein [Sandaracinaceae bacterium]
MPAARRDRSAVAGRLAVAVALAVLASCGGPQGRAALPPGACRPADVPPPQRVAVPAAFAPRRGAERPRVVIQGFSDFECPYCARAVPTLERVLAEYGDCVQIVWRNRPLEYHAHAEDAARAALEVYRQGGDEAFWRYHDRLFANQSRLSRADLIEHARAIGGIDLSALEEALASGAHRAVIERDLAAVDAIEPRLGAPTFFVNGTVIHGARPYETFRDAVEDALRASR